MAALEVAEAVARVMRGVAPLEIERVALDDALGRVLAEPLRAPLTLPQWTNSAMDGYAVRADDVRGESLPSGHYVNEEAPEQVLEWFLRFFGG